MGPGRSAAACAKVRGRLMWLAGHCGDKRCGESKRWDAVEKGGVGTSEPGDIGGRIVWLSFDRSMRDMLRLNK